MHSERDSVIQLSAPGAPPDLLFNATQQLITEINREVGPVASRAPEKGEPGAKGDAVTLGTIVLALISAGITQQIAQVLISYMKRNPRLKIRVGKIEITKDHASTDDVSLISSVVLELKKLEQQ